MKPEIRMNAHEKRRLDKTEMRPMTVRGVQLSDAPQALPFAYGPQVFGGIQPALSASLHEIAHCGGWHLGRPMR